MGVGLNPDSQPTCCESEAARQDTM